MKKRIITLVFTLLLLISGSVISFAADPVLQYESSYDDETGLVSVSMYVTNAVGLEAADFKLAYNAAMYEYSDHSTADLGMGGMLVAGNVDRKPGLATCSVLFTESCDESLIDSEGRLYIATFTFKPITEEYDINEFCYWAGSFDINGSSVAKSLNTCGNVSLMEGRTDSIVVPETLPPNTIVKKGSSNKLGAKWYVYVIAGVLAFGAVAGIAFVAIKSNQQAENEKNVESDENKTDNNKE